MMEVNQTEAGNQLTTDKGYLSMVSGGLIQFSPSDMEKATSDKAAVGTGKPARRRGPEGDTGDVTHEEVLPIAAPARITLQGLQVLRGAGSGRAGSFALIPMRSAGFMPNGCFPI